MNNKKWTQEEDDLIKSLVNNYSYDQIAKMLNNRTAGAVSYRVRNEFKINNTYRPRKWNHDEYFWETPNILNSYWAGFMCADGCVIKTHKGKILNRFTCGLSTKDEDHLKLFKDTVKHTGPFKYCTRKSPSSDNLVYSVHLNIHGEKWLSDLDKNFNIIPNKSARIGPPNYYKEELLFCFLVGYLDGDGCISKINDGRMNITFVSGSREMLLWIKNFVNKRFTYNYNDRDQNLSFTTSSINKKCERLTFNGYKAAIIFDYLRKIPVPKLDRKWNNPEVLVALETYKQKKPELFTYKNIPPIENYLNFI